MAISLDDVRGRAQFLVQAPKIAGGSREEARRQAQEIARRDPARGLLAWLEVAATDEDPEELRLILRTLNANAFNFTMPDSACTRSSSRRRPTQP